MTEWQLQATILRVHDGDTPFADIDQGLDEWHHNLGLRLAISEKAWINARELSAPGGPEARDNLAALLPVSSVWTIRSFGWDKYGLRIDCDIILANGGSLAQLLVDHQWAAEYDGVGPAPVPPWPRTIT